MESWFLYISMCLTVIILIPFYRVIKGPTVFDRLLGANAIGTKTVVLILLLGCIYGRIDMFIDIALAYAILSFITALIIAKYLSSQRRKHDSTE
jgi:multicomponent Na+:H+ antiporter subunit F